ncbi:MAG: hypothetical protein IPP78_15815 [Holophagaceae bacterium]|nr:hypothetical protein [Holophagaceae bacterium]
MRSSDFLPGRANKSRFLLVSALAFLLLCCVGKDSNKVVGPISIAPFIQVAKQSQCHDVRNRLFLIDRHLVFWDRAGHCPDNSFAQILYSDSPDTVLCERHDSVGGEVKTCPNPQYQTLFDTAIINIEQPDLGLSGTHMIQPIFF